MQLRIAHQITPTVLHPTNIQRSSARMTMSLFSDSTVNALCYYSEECHKPWNGTHMFVKLMNVLVRIINTKSSTVGKRKRDQLREPVRTWDGEKLLALERYHDFFLRWETSGRKGCSRETFMALQLMCQSLVGVSRYLLADCGYLYVLLGQLQGDPIERRFGRARQMSGANFFISVKQLLDSEHKIHSLLHHSGLTVADFSCFHELDLEDHRVSS
jgi:hypothetical protein